MSLFTRNPQRTQVEWGKTPDGRHTWFVNIDAPVSDQKVITSAQLIVDHCSPQRYGPNSDHGFSFLKREYLLNLLLFHYADYGFFPSGHICITDDWLYGNPIRLEGGGSWFAFKNRALGRQYKAGWWIKIPSFEEITQRSSEFEPQGHYPVPNH